MTATSLFSVDKGLSINDNVVYIYGANEPSSVDASIAPRGSTYVDVVNGQSWIKSRPGSTPDAWDLILTTDKPIVWNNISSKTVVDSVNAATNPGFQWDILVVDANNPLNTFFSTISATSNYRGNIEATVVKHSLYGIVRQGSSVPGLVIDVELDHIQSTQVLSLTAFSSITTINVTVYRRVTEINKVSLSVAASSTASELLNQVKTVGGAGSDLDADLLDGHHASDFEFTTNRGIPSGYCPLDINGTIPLEFIPDSVLTPESPKSFTGSLSGDIITSSFSNRWYPGSNIIITSVFFSVGTPPTVGSVIVDVLRNDVSIFSSTKPELNANSYKSTTISTNIVLTPDDYITFSVVQASGGTDLTLFVSYI